MMADQIGLYSSKMTALLSTLLQSDGKVLIYHNDVNLTGVLTIKELLIYNGYVEGESQFNAQSVCFKCGRRI
jgi:hypothetical protein